MRGWAGDGGVPTHPIVLQSLVGMRKYFLLLPPTRKRSYWLHGIVGPFIYLLAMIVVVLGAFSWWSGDITPWEATFRVILPCVAALLVLLGATRHAGDARVPPPPRPAYTPPPPSHVPCIRRASHGELRAPRLPPPASAAVAQPRRPDHCLRQRR